MHRTCGQKLLEALVTDKSDIDLHIKCSLEISRSVARTNLN